MSFQVLLGRKRDDIVARMPVSEQERTALRFSGVCTFPIPEPVNVIIGTRKLAATISEISTSGGMLQIPEAVARKGFASIAMKTTFGLLDAPIEFLQISTPGKRNAVAFRFFHVDPVQQDRLEKLLEQMRKRGLGDNQGGSWMQRVLRLVLPR